MIRILKEIADRVRKLHGDCTFDRALHDLQIKQENT